MSRINQAKREILIMNELNNNNTIIHKMDPLSKFVITIAYLFIVVSFQKYDLDGLFVMILFPIIGYQLALLSVGKALWKMKYILPLLALVGLANPFFDREIHYMIGSLSITGGVLSFLTLLLKGILCLLASFLLVATTKIEEICQALIRLHIPKFMVTLLLLTYRYIFVLMDEVDIMTEAYHLRAPKQKGIHFKAWGSFLGQLILRSMDRAEQIYDSMILRGYTGEFFYESKKNRWTMLMIFMIVGMMLLTRLFDFPGKIASWF